VVNCVKNYSDVTWPLGVITPNQTHIIRKSNYQTPNINHRVPTPPGKSCILFIENSRTWKVLENHFGPGY